MDWRQKALEVSARGTRDVGENQENSYYDGGLGDRTQALYLK